MADGRAIASPHRRVLAGVVDATVFLPLLGGMGWAGFKLYPRYRRWRDPQSDTSATGWLAKAGSFKLSRRVQVAMWVGGCGAKVALRNRRSPGWRLLRIRVADAGTGGPVSVRSVLIREAVTAGQNQALKRIRRPAEQRRRQRMEALNAQVDAIRREHARDKAAQERAIMQLFKDNDANPLGSCMPALLGSVAMFLPALLTPNRQTLPELLAGVIIVMDS
jgi:hypothetical protein